MTKAKYILSGLLFVLYSFILNAQGNAIDSLRRNLQTQKEDSNKVNILNNFCLAFTGISSYDSALYYADQGRLLAEKINFKRGQAKAFENIGWVYQTLGNYDTAKENYLSAIKIYEELSDRSGIAWCNCRIANTFYTESDIAAAIKISYDALKLFEEIDDKPGIAYSYILIGNLYYEEANYSEALKIFISGLKICEALGDKRYAGYCNHGIARIDAKQGNYPEAFSKFSNVLKIFEEVDDKPAIVQTHRYMGELFETLGNNDVVTSKSNYAEALKSYSRVLSFYEDIKDKGGVVTGNQYVGRINVKLGNYREAKKYLENALVLAGEIGSNGDLRDTYLSYSILDSSQGDYKQAYEHHKMYILYRDSVSNEETKRKSVRAAMQYDFDKKDALAKTEQIKKDAAVKRTRNLQYTIIGAFIFFVVFLYLNNRQKQRANTKIENAYAELKATQKQLIQSEKMASLGELTAGIAHEIQNPLNFVNNFSEVSSELLGEMKNELKNKNFDDAIEIADDVIGNLEKVLHHGKRADAIVKGMLQHSRVHEVKRELTDINKLADEYLRLSYQGLKAKDKSFNASLQTDFDSSLEKINIVPQDIGRVLLNLYNNAFYAVNEKERFGTLNYAPAVSVSTKKVKNKVEITVSDNGNGIPASIKEKIFQPFFTTKPTGQGTGLGLSLSYDIIKAHGGEIKVETREGEGAEFVIYMPV